MKEQEFITKIIEKTNLPRVTVEQVIYTFLNTLAECMGEKEKVRFKGFGTFEGKLANERMCRNPYTGEMIKVAKHTVPHFKASKVLKECVNTANPEQLEK